MTHRSQNTKASSCKTFAPCSHCQRTINPPEFCRSGPYAAKRPTRFKQDQPAENAKEGQEQGKSTTSEPKSIPENDLNHQNQEFTGLIRHQWDNISDRPTIVYHSHKTLNTGIPTVVWQQQNEEANVQTIAICSWSKKLFQPMNTTTQKTWILSLHHS